MSETCAELSRSNKKSEQFAGANCGDACPERPPAASGRGLEADKKLIQKLFSIEPLDWARREDGTLVYLNQACQKFVIPMAELERLINTWHEKDKVLKKAGINPEKRARPEPVERVRAELIDKPAGAAPASQVLGGPSKPASGEAGVDARSGVDSTQSLNEPPAEGAGAPAPASVNSA